jgi:hypothetical protein
MVHREPHLQEPSLLTVCSSGDLDVDLDRLPILEQLGEELLIAMSAGIAAARSLCVAPGLLLTCFA